MILIKKINVEKHFAAKRAMREAGTLPASRSGAPVASEAKPGGIRTNAKGFVEDFSAEHSSNKSVPPSI
jgi:hypothetical protein